MTNLPNIDHLADPSATEAQFQAAIEALYDVVSELIGGTAVGTATLATDAFTPTVGLTIVDTEGAAASDNLANITPTNTPDGRVILICAANAGRVITVKHEATGSGQIYLTGEADVVLNHTQKWIMLRYKSDGDKWFEVMRSWGINLPAGTDAAAARTALGLSSYLALAGGTMTGALNFAKAGDVASASTINLDSATGNLVPITGTTTVTAITLAAGAHRIIRATSSFQLTHSSSLSCPGDANIVLAAGDYAIVAGLGSGVTEVISILRASSMPAFLGEVQAWAKAQGVTFVALSDGATVNWNLDTAQNAKITLGGSRTFALPTNIRDGFVYVLRVTQDGTGSRIITWNAAYKFGTDGEPTLTTTASKTDYLVFIGFSTTQLHFQGIKKGF